MDETLPTAIPSSMRPPKSLIAHVKSTLSDLVSSVFKRSNGAEKFVIGKEGESLNEASSEKPDLSNETINNSHLVKNGTSSLENSPAISKSQQIRTKEAYQKRVKSFTLSLWCGKPLSLSPPLLAQYGWECIGENLAKCCVCGAVIAIHLPWPNSSNYHIICKESQEKIIKGHKKICSWPTNPTNDSYLNPFHEEFLSREEKEHLKRSFTERVHRLYDLKNKLPHVTLEILAEMELDEELLGKLIRFCGFPEEVEKSGSDIVEENISEHAMHTSSVVLALCGWDKEPNNQLPCIHCQDTGRTVGLWNFYSVSPQDENTSPITAKRRRLDGGTPKTLIVEKGWFHPVSQHHIWSPWVVSLNPISALLSESSVGPKKRGVKPGWKVLRDILLQKESLPTSGGDAPSSIPLLSSSKTPPRQAVLQARRLIEDWSSP